MKSCLWRVITVILTLGFFFQGFASAESTPLEQESSSVSVPHYVINQGVINQEVINQEQVLFLPQNRSGQGGKGTSSIVAFSLNGSLPARLPAPVTIAVRSRTLKNGSLSDVLSIRALGQDLKIPLQRRKAFFRIIKTPLGTILQSKKLKAGQAPPEAALVLLRNKNGVVMNLFFLSATQSEASGSQGAPLQPVVELNSSQQERIAQVLTRDPIWLILEQLERSIFGAKKPAKGRGNEKISALGVEESPCSRLEDIIKGDKTPEVLKVALRELCISANKLATLTPQERRNELLQVERRLQIVRDWYIGFALTNELPAALGGEAPPELAPALPPARGPIPPAPAPTRTPSSSSSPGAPPCEGSGGICQFRDLSTTVLVTVPCCATHPSGDSLECLSSSLSNPDNKRCYRNTSTPVPGSTTTAVPTRTPTPALGCDVNSCIPGGIGGPCSRDLDCAPGPIPTISIGTPTASCESIMSGISCGVCKRPLGDPNGPYGTLYQKRCTSPQLCKYQPRLCTSAFDSNCCMLANLGGGSACTGTCVIPTVGSCASFASAPPLPAGQCSRCYTTTINTWLPKSSCALSTTCTDNDPYCHGDPPDGKICNGTCLPTPPTATPIVIGGGCNDFAASYPPPSIDKCYYCYGTDLFWYIGAANCSAGKSCSRPSAHDGSTPPHYTTTCETLPTAQPTIISQSSCGIIDPILGPQCIFGITGSRACNIDPDCIGWTPPEDA